MRNEEGGGQSMMFVVVWYGTRYDRAWGFFGAIFKSKGKREHTLHREKQEKDGITPPSFAGKITADTNEAICRL